MIIKEKISVIISVDRWPGSYIYIILAGLSALLVVSIILLSSVPPVSRDALTHHLAVPKLYLKHGGMYEIPSVIFSYYPMNLELLYIIPLYFGNDIIPNYLHFLFALLTAFLVYRYLETRTGKLFAIFGALFFLSLPVIIKLSISAYVDLGLVFFSTASIIFLFKWIECDFRFKNLLLSALFCGLALGTKYNALIVFFLLPMFVMFSYARIAGNKDNRQESVGNGNPVSIKALFRGVLYVIIVILVFSPWMIRNYVWTKNPVYPLYQSIFSRLSPETSFPARGDESDGNSITEQKKTEGSGEWSHFAVRRIIYNESLPQIALVPLRIFFEGEDGNPRLFDGKLSPFLFILPFFAFMRIRHDSFSLKIEKGILLLFSILFILFAFVKTDMRIRYIAPVVPPLVMLSVMGLHDIFLLLKVRFTTSSGRFILSGFFFFSAVIVSVNGIYLFEQFRLVKPFEYLLGGVSRDEYIEKYRPEYAAIRYANGNIPENAKILCFFLGNRRYYSDREMLFDEIILKNAVKSANTEDKVVAAIRGKNITHFIIWYDMFNKWVNNNFKEDEKALLGRFFEANAVLLFSKGGYGLYALNLDR